MCSTSACTSRRRSTSCLTSQLLYWPTAAHSTGVVDRLALCPDLAQVGRVLWLFGFWGAAWCVGSRSSRIGSATKLTVPIGEFDPTRQKPEPQGKRSEFVSLSHRPGSNRSAGQRTQQRMLSGEVISIVVRRWLVRRSSSRVSHRLIIAFSAARESTSGIGDSQMRRSRLASHSTPPSQERHRSRADSRTRRTRNASGKNTHRSFSTRRRSEP